MSRTWSFPAWANWIGLSPTGRLCSMVDSFSNLKPCGDQCQGREENRWLRSGDAMFFNAKWNQTPSWEKT